MGKKNAVNKEELEFLRENTKLGIIGRIKIKNAIDVQDRFHILFYRMKGELIDFDYEPIYELEYELRFKVWEKMNAPLWKEHPDGLGLYDFSKMVMEQHIENEKSKKRTKKK